MTDGGSVFLLLAMEPKKLTDLSRDQASSLAPFLLLSQISLIDFVLVKVEEETL
jgi:hypothetical protein